MKIVRIAVLCMGFGAAGAAVSTGCGGSDSTGSNPSGAGGTGTATGQGGAASTASFVTSSGSGGHPIITCQGHVYECGDGIDNDGDGLIDSDDPDCLGPCDNTEGSYYGGIPGQNNAPCKMDCYFDQDTGPGNDDCYWSHECDPHEMDPGYYPEHDLGNKCAYDLKANIPGTNKSCDELYMQQSAACLAYCGPLTPNGCDCFGCCELPAGTGKYVWLGSTVNGQGSCDIANVNDPAKCQPCEPVKACLNPCGHCELCIGKDKLPDDCYGPDAGTDGGSSSTGGGGGGGGGGGQCPPGVQVCGLPGQAPCSPSQYCITGCCQDIPK